MWDKFIEIEPNIGIIYFPCIFNLHWWVLLRYVMLKLYIADKLLLVSNFISSNQCIRKNFFEKKEGNIVAHLWEVTLFQSIPRSISSTIICPFSAKLFLLKYPVIEVAVAGAVRAHFLRYSSSRPTASNVAACEMCFCLSRLGTPLQ